ncbi:hypothetical protein TH66_20395 [Carbonactinospora thermoautotrophica]|uniref:Uncharacterized protein n=1 Tax=Carbonactinospora thermoautotrophica TaxID=1469144 RepID=A0A132MJ62_9ACTN|nr:hypothetical protein [Carbonactinospora thermoautotrophica]KWW97805.1 hypothetical protein TH66_20395 [Carbonactinospora thermoautotrophica]KWX09970.1 hypothetical protein TR74_06465 [Carbonactinospora thermoautotrophica]
MELSNVLSLIGLLLSVVGIVIGTSVAIWIHRRESEERRKSDAAAVERATQLERQRQQEERERQARETRRLKHQEDYKAAAKALDQLEEAFYQVEINGLLTDADMKQRQVRENVDLIDKLSQRIASLAVPFAAVSALGHDAWMRGLSDRTASEVREEIWNGIQQYEAAKRALKAIGAARAALDKEWEA